MNKIAIIALLICTAVFAQQKGIFTDTRDGKTYKYTTIGEQIWMAQNLDYAGKNDDIGSCYNKKPENCEKYGALYSRDEAMKVCPSGWHLPNNNEWQILVNFAGGKEIAGKKLKAKSDWNEEEYRCKYTTKETTGRGNVIVTEHDECTTDEFGFSALPSGKGEGGLFGKFHGVGYIGFWWSSTALSIKYNDAKVNFIYVGIADFFSVRCVKD
jgi:uncharacterized protein (TIGR02145 family)